ncbi:MAG: ComF family protein, partial [Sphingomonadales bacterium]
MDQSSPDYVATSRTKRKPQRQKRGPGLGTIISRNLVLSLKYQGRRDGLSVRGGWMTNAGRDLLADADLIVPVPLHYFRLIRRGFNQSVWLAAALSRASGVRLSVDAIKRTKSTPM